MTLIILKFLLNVCFHFVILIISHGHKVDEKLSLADFNEIKTYNYEKDRYLIYDVNFGEGFNLRRDVYMRIANTVRQLRERGFNYTLVLPPWGGLYHWNENPPNFKQPWKKFFDLKSLSKFVPIIEFDQFLMKNNKSINLILYLQHYAQCRDNENSYVIKYDEEPCIEAKKYYYKKNNNYIGFFFSYEKDVKVNFLKCLSIQGQSSTLADAITKNYLKHTSIFVDKAETILHDNFGDVFYWKARRSMRYAKNLCLIANTFRKEKLNSSYEQDLLHPLAEDWEKDLRPRNSLNVGGKYLCVHWRRADFLRAHANDLPSVNGTVDQIKELCKKLHLNNVFLSTDANIDEIQRLNVSLYKNSINLFLFSSYLVKNNIKNLSPGEISIIDQWICAHARYFIGTHLSTFSFRIHEDREILGFHPSTTFNRFCPDLKGSENKYKCEQPAKWKIVYN